MKLSEVTDAVLAEYLKHDYATMTATEKTELTAFRTATISFIKGYTGLDFSMPINEVIAIGDGITTVYTIPDAPTVVGSQTIYIDNVEQILDTDYTFNATKGIVTFATAPIINASITATYQSGLDAHDDISIAAFVLVSDMYDNRSIYVDKSSLNRTVDIILGMHRTNLL